MANSYSLSLLGWFLYLGVPGIIWTLTTIWYLNRQRTTNGTGGDPA